MKKLAVLAMASVMAASFTVAAFAAEEPVVFKKGTAKVDADFSDYTAAGVKPLVVAGDDYAADAADVEGCAFDVYYMNDAKNMYFCFDVTAPVVDWNKSGGDIWNQSGIEWFFGTKQYGAALDPDDKATPIFAWGETSAFNGAAYKKTDKGFVFEFSFDIALVAEEAPDFDIFPGGSFPISMGVDYLAEEGGSRTGQLYYPIDWAWGNVDTYATATLAK